MLFFLLAGHALMDYSLQTEAMATCKSRRAKLPLQRIVPWYYWLTAHAVLHGLAVGLIVRWFDYDWPLAVGFALAETGTHWFIDFLKCEQVFNIHIDQALHLVCKVIWWGLLAGGVMGS